MSSTAGRALLADFATANLKGEVSRSGHFGRASAPTVPHFVQTMRLDRESLGERSGKKPGGQQGHKGETLRQVTDPDEVVDHRYVRRWSRS